MRVGIISDTHNYLDPSVAEIFTGVDHILHAGDIGQPRIILELENIAPVTAVGGNTDDPGFQYTTTESVVLEGHKCLLHHIVQPRELPDFLKARIAKEKADVVVFGHTHKPFCETIKGTLFFNPGYAGKSRFGMERTVAVLSFESDKIHPEYFRLTS
jgi:putative phosphoesterase